MRSKRVLNLVSSFVATRVADPLHFDAEPDADPACQFDAGQDPTFHIDADADPDPDPRFQIKSPNLEKVLK